MSNKRITVFTPTYNRAHMIINLYQSLQRQTVRDFEWLVIDDGSTDNTEILFKGIIKKNNEFKIRYYKKNNGGMHTAYNVAYRLIKTELNVCIDSDDYMPDDAIETILKIWDMNNKDDLAGIIGLNATYEGDIIGTNMPKDVYCCTFTELFHKYHAKGDKKVVYRTDVINNVPEYPEFEGEKKVPNGYKYILVDREYKMLLLDKILCHVEYQSDGLGRTIYKQYFESPRGYAEYRKLQMKYTYNLKGKIKACMHYILNSIWLKNSRYIIESPCRIMTLITTPLGVLFFIYRLLVLYIKEFINYTKGV